MRGNIDDAIDTMRAALDAGTVSHTRLGDRLFRGLVLVYGRSAESPNAVHFLCAVPEHVADEYLRGSLSPLSPSEPR